MFSPPKEDDGGMLEYAFVEDGEVGCATADVYDRHSGFQVFLSHDGRGRGKGLEDEVLGEEVTFFDGAVDIPDSILIPGDDMKIGADLHPSISDRVRYVLEIVYGELLWR